MSPAVVEENFTSSPRATTPTESEAASSIDLDYVLGAWKSADDDQVQTLSALPLQLIDRYVDAAMRRASLEWIPEDPVWYAEVSALPDVWASGKSEDEALAELRSVIRGWVLLKIEEQDRDFPELDAINLNVL